MLKVGTDFSGIGSPEIALKNLGVNFKSMFACDYDKYAKQSYLINHKTENFYDDITTRNHSKTPYVDLYIAGFPCQAFSTAGKRQGFDDTRGTLFFDLLQYLKAQRPKYFILENVKGLMSHDNGKTFSTIINILAKTINGQMFMPFYSDNIGYNIYHKVLNTKDYGLPQNRERIFIVGFRDDNHTFRWPKPFKLELKLKDILQDNPDSKYNLTQLGVKNLMHNQKFNKFKLLNKENGVADCITSRCNKISNDNNFLEVDKKYNLSKNTPLEKGTGNVLYNRKGFRTNTQVYDINKICGTIDTSTGGGRQPHILVDEKYYLSDKAIEIKINKTQFGKHQQDCYYDADGLMGTIPAGTHGSTPHLTKTKLSNNRIRRLTPLECLRLQGFPDEFYHKCKEDGLSDSQIYKQAGNSMTSDVMYYLIKEILKNGY